ncbi:hypothetical protein GCM10007860_15370 [Chitiniphilus shinanonensis]|uniref:Uncharacterized protein n=1 Tax=Chitiniphilus shinanonensis TaxID=553088 RepID=A0ABQ6BQU1_9NEIS|nr:hypothetical protein [Chitiniphilus shinanonensis]GLS04390.1 hypothetical protein GCM10007860_15370 [Chitiniphilus shinanonensis]
MNNISFGSGHSYLSFEKEQGTLLPPSDQGRSGFSCTLQQLETSFSREAFKELRNPVGDLISVATEAPSPNLQQRTQPDGVSDGEIARSRFDVQSPAEGKAPLLPSSTFDLFVLRASKVNPGVPKSMGMVELVLAKNSSLENLSFDGASGTSALPFLVKNENKAPAEKRYRFYQSDRNGRQGVVLVSSQEDTLNLWNDPDVAMALGSIPHDGQVDELIVSGKKSNLKK